VGKVVLDARVVIALIEGGDAHHADAHAALLRHTEDELILPASAYAEVLVRPAREGKVAEVRTDLHTLALRIDAIGEASAEEAAALRGRFTSLRLPDALVLGHAEAIGADVVLTTDRRWRRVAANVAVVG
jgi:predicted nucleic acid-binding protein